MWIRLFCSQLQKYSCVTRKWGYLLIILWLIQGCHATRIYPLGSFVPVNPQGINEGTLAIIVNQQDPLSQKVADYYQRQRQIPPENVIRISFRPGQTNLSVKTFQKLRDTVQTQTPSTIQAYALTWAAPYRVGCMSITSAFTFGFDPAFCADGCSATQASSYFNSPSRLPYRDLGLRPTMALAARSWSQAQQLIDRGRAADGTFPKGTAYLLSTSDDQRNIRAASYPAILSSIGRFFNVELLTANQIQEKTDVMFYFTGLTRVPGLDTNQFLPGAVADHLTSYGGQLTSSPQMSSLRWLEAGASGSYGAVVEPCNFPQKFPHPGVLMAHYLSGATLIEAYWKSVLWPGQGIFIGDHLAQPFRRQLLPRSVAR